MLIIGQRENLAAQPAHISNMATPNDVISGKQLREASQAEPARDCGDTKYYHDICPIFVNISLESFKKYRSGVVTSRASLRLRRHKIENVVWGNLIHSRLSDLFSRCVWGAWWLHTTHTGEHTGKHTGEQGEHQSNTPAPGPPNSKIQSVHG